MKRNLLLALALTVMTGCGGGGIEDSSVMSPVKSSMTLKSFTVNPTSIPVSQTVKFAWNLDYRSDLSMYAAQIYISNKSDIDPTAIRIATGGTSINGDINSATCTITDAYTLDCKGELGPHYIGFLDTASPLYAILKVCAISAFSENACKEAAVQVTFP